MRALVVLCALLLPPLASATVAGEGWILPAYSPWRGNCRTFPAGTHSFVVSGAYVSNARPGSPGALALADAWGSSDPYYATWAASPFGLNVAVIPTWQAEPSGGVRPDLDPLSGFHPDPAHAYAFDVAVGSSFAQVCMWIEDPVYSYNASVGTVATVRVFDNPGGLVVRTA